MGRIVGSKRLAIAPARGKQRTSSRDGRDSRDKACSLPQKRRAQASEGENHSRRLMKAC